MLIPVIDSKRRLRVPDKLYPNLTPIHAFKIGDLAEFADHRRMKVFFFKGLECSNPKCKNKARYLIASKSVDNGISFNLFTKDFILMNVDHIIPKSKGGSNNISNLQPTCYTCNSIKDSHSTFIEKKEKKEEDNFISSDGKEITKTTKFNVIDSITNQIYLNQIYPDFRNQIKNERFIFIADRENLEHYKIINKKVISINDVLKNYHENKEIFIENMKKLVKSKK